MRHESKRIMEMLTTLDFADFCRNNSISLALLFGSRATNRARDNSDFDLAVLLDAEYPQDVLARASQKRELLHNLVAYFSTSRFDLVILNDASSLLVYEVVQSGKVLYEAKPGEFARLASLTIRQHSDNWLFREAEKKFLSQQV